MYHKPFILYIKDHFLLHCLCILKLYWHKNCWLSSCIQFVKHCRNSVLPTFKYKYMYSLSNKSFNIIKPWAKKLWFKYNYYFLIPIRILHNTYILNPSLILAYYYNCNFPKTNTKCACASNMSCM